MQRADCATVNTPDAPTNGTLRLADAAGSPCSHAYAGRLEIYINGQWGAVCNDGFSSSLTAVQVRALQLVSSLAIDGARVFTAAYW